MSENIETQVEKTAEEQLADIVKSSVAEVADSKSR